MGQLPRKLEQVIKERVAHPTTISSKPKSSTLRNVGFISLSYSLKEAHISKNFYWETFSPVYQTYLKLKVCTITYESYSYPVIVSSDQTQL